VASGEPLMVELGPGLLGQIFDGVQRPLATLASLSGDFIRRGISHAALDREKRWRFEPLVRAGQELAEGQVLGTIRETGSLVHRVMAPPGVEGRIASVKDGELTVSDAVVVLEDGRGVPLLQRWPVRQRRPFKRRLTPAPFSQPAGARHLLPDRRRGTAIIRRLHRKDVLGRRSRVRGDDVIVYVGCGERGNEMTDVLTEFPALEDPRTGAPLMDRTVLVVNTSNMPVAAREASIYTGVTIAEYFRDMGYQVALMADSTSRWAEALREISSRLEEMPGEEGYPTYLATRLGAFFERAGRVIPLSGEGEGAVTIVGAVSPPGGDFSEPVTQASLRISGALWALSTDLAYRRHFPAIDWVQSFSLYAERFHDWFGREVGKEWITLREDTMRLLQKERELQDIVQLVGLDAVQDQERVVIESARLVREGFLRQSALSGVDASCPPKRRSPCCACCSITRALLAGARRGASLKAILAAGLTSGCALGEVPAGEMEAGRRADGRHRHDPEAAEGA
jgi:V/A-type H+-transporting ATPase subunit A